MTTLYRLYGPNDELLYVGISANPGLRFQQHASDKPWWTDTLRIHLEHHPTRLAALIAEREAIINEHPRHNVTHNGSRFVQECSRCQHRIGKKASHYTLTDGQIVCIRCLEKFNLWDQKNPGSATRAGLRHTREDETGWVFHDRSGHRRHQPELWLYPELDGSSCVDDLWWTDDGEEELDYYIDYVRRTQPDWWANDAVPIYWSVAPVHETAPFQEVWSKANGPTSWGDFLTYFTWPHRPNGEPLDWFTLPVKNDRFPNFAKALNWLPAPLQPYAPLRSIIRSRNHS